MIKACIILADGFEEVEAVTPIDYLRRAGFDLTVAGLTGSAATGAHGLALHCDCSLASLDLAAFDIIILPGGLPGTTKLAADSRVLRAVREQLERGKHVAAICAAPALVLGKAGGLLHGRRYTCYPGLEREVPAGGHYSGEAVTVDGRLITAAGAACAQGFALRIVAELAGQAAADQLAASLLVKLAQQA